MNDMMETTVAAGGAFLLAASGQWLAAQIPGPPPRLLSFDGGAMLFIFWAGLWIGWLFGRKQHGGDTHHHHHKDRKDGESTDQK